MPDFEVMPPGTRAAMTEAAQLFRTYELHHRHEAARNGRLNLTDAEKSRLEKAERNAEAAAKLEALLEQPGVERSGDVFTTKGATIPLGKPMPLRNAMDSGIPGDPPLCGV